MHHRRSKPKRVKATIADLVTQIGLVMRGQLDPATLRWGGPTDELAFHPTRRWRFDLAEPTRRVAVELEGALFKGHRAVENVDALTRAGQVLRPADINALKQMGGRHNRGQSMSEDMVKYNEAAAMGWIVLKVTSEMIEDGRAVTWFERCWKGRPHWSLNTTT